jgi:hypothetical protein
MESTEPILISANAEDASAQSAMTVASTNRIGIPPMAVVRIRFWVDLN